MRTWGVPIQGDRSGGGGSTHGWGPVWMMGGGPGGFRRGGLAQGKTLKCSPITRTFSTLPSFFGQYARERTAW